MKKILAIVLALAMVVAMRACGTGTTPAASTGDTTAPAAGGVTLENIKVGFVHVSDPSDMGYTYNHDRGTNDMKAALGLKDEQIINKYNVPETAECGTALRELAEDGCNIIFATSFGFEQYVLEVAAEYPEIQFCHATGYQAAGSGLANVHNYFGAIYQARYLSGIAAGLKAKEIGNNVLGYVTAMPFAECISGFTGFYLGAKSVNPDVTMKVMYTNAWNDPTTEAQVAQALIDAGCGVISQHCDSTAPATVAQQNGAFHVGYNSDMTSVAPNASLTSAVWDWSQYLTFAVNCVVNGETIPVDWSKGLKEGVCDISPLNTAIIAAGTEDAIAAAREKINGGWEVFTGPLHGAGVDFDGNAVEINLADGETFVEPASAPSWNYVIDGIEVIG